MKVADIRIELAGIRPPIWRRVAVPVEMHLAELHMVIQTAMGWLNSHLWEFDVADHTYGVQDPLDGSMWGEHVGDARTLRLSRVIDLDVTKFEYLYDFGDSWQHRVIVRSVHKAEPGVTYPRLLAGKRCCPPEDVGGVPGYCAFLEALANPEEAENGELLEHYRDSFDPETIDTEAISARLKRIGDGWRPGKQ